jgi:hypothetical protein
MRVTSLALVAASAVSSVLTSPASVTPADGATTARNRTGKCRASTSEEK